MAPYPLSFLLAFFLPFVALGQDSEEILAEGKLLYRVETASWKGTDDFLSRFSDKRDQIGGYVSYESETDGIITLFFSNQNPDSILVRYRFDRMLGSLVEIDTVNTKVTAYEKDLIALQQDAARRISDNADGFFTFYENTSFNLVPLITKQSRKVYVMTAPQVSDVVILGNDYLLAYNKKNKLKSKTRIHESLLQYPYQSDKTGNIMKSTVHSHVVSPYIDATDICTLLLYKDYVEWKQHYVISETYVSIFDMEKEELLIMTRKAWDKIYDHQKNKE
jgi:hypothetical protein